MPKDSEKAMAPVEERTVDFYGDELKGVVVMATPSERIIYVPVRPLCDFLGIDVQAQTRRIARDPVLSEEVAIIQVSTAGGPQDMQC